jgi:hypothetical protein
VKKLLLAAAAVLALAGSAQARDWWGQLQYFPEVGEYLDLNGDGAPLHIDFKSFGQDEVGCTIKRITVEPTSHTLNVTASCTIGDVDQPLSHEKWHVDKIDNSGHLDVFLTTLRNTMDKPS